MAGSPHVACCVVVFASTLPLFAHTGKILLQTTPAHLKAGLERCRREVTTIPGVLECKDEHFWTQAPGMLPHPAHAGAHAGVCAVGVNPQHVCACRLVAGYVVGSVVVRVQYNANEQVGGAHRGAHSGGGNGHSRWWVCAWLGRKS